VAVAVPVAASAPGAGAPHLRIGEVSRRSGVSVKTIRFYCDQGLIQPSTRSEGGFRLFDAAILADLAIIRALRAMDVPLPELARILEVRRSGVCNCSVLKSSIGAKVDSIDQRIAELAAMKGELEALLQGWQDCGGSKESPSAAPFRRPTQPPS
jgi:MerR family copper efflux transcriptional regulator